VKPHDRWRRRPTTLAGPADGHLPLHCKVVQPLSYASLLDTIPEHRRQSLRDLIAWNTSSAGYEDVAIDSPEFPASTVTRADLQTMQEAGYITPVDQASLRRVGKLFFVAEPHKMRRRVIFWPRQLNDELRRHKRESGLDWLAPNIEDTLAAIDDLSAPGMWATTADLAISFNQCALSDDVKPFFGFRVGKQCFAMQRMPMGEVVAPAIMHAITEALMEQAAAGLTVTPRAYVDNVRFVGNKAEVAEAMRRFQALCARTGVTLNEEAGNTPHQTGEFLGIVFDYAHQRVSLSSRTQSKLHAFAQQLSSARLTTREFMTGYGLLEYSSRVTRVSASSAFDARKFASRRAMQLDAGSLRETDDVRLWADAHHSITAWLDTVLQSTPVPPSAPTTTTTEFVLATDASVTGWGAVLGNASVILTAQGTWPKKHTCEEINQLEAGAIANALTQFSDMIGPRTALTLLTDNSATMFTLRKGRAHEFPLNGAVDRVLRALRGNPNVRVAHIETERNPADSLSRESALDRQLASTLWAEGRRREATALRVAAPLTFPPARRERK